MKNNQTIAKFGSRKDHVQLLCVKERLKDLHCTPLSLLNDKKIFVNESPCHYWNDPPKTVTLNGLMVLLPGTDIENLQLPDFFWINFT